MQEEPFRQTQRFQQALATTITCRSIIKYNSTLSDEQKNEILSEMETTLDFLKDSLTANSAFESSTALSPQKLAEFLELDEASDDVAPEESLSPYDREEQDISLRNLYKLYHAYLSNEPGKGIVALESRYHTVIEVLDQLQDIITQPNDRTVDTQNAEHLLHRVRGFITAVYCMFREFAAQISNILEGKNIDMDTEALSLLPQYSLDETKQQIMRDISPLMHIYNAHLQLQERKGILVDCARDATAFLLFLPERLDPTLVRHDEIVTQLHAIASLTEDLTQLLTRYEQTMAGILRT